MQPSLAKPSYPTSPQRGVCTQSVYMPIIHMYICIRYIIVFFIAVLLPRFVPLGTA